MDTWTYLPLFQWDKYFNSWQEEEQRSKEEGRKNKQHLWCSSTSSLMQVSSTSSRRKRKPNGKTVAAGKRTTLSSGRISSGGGRGGEEGAIVESSFDDTLSLGSSRPGKMPGMKQEPEVEAGGGGGASAAPSHSSLSHQSSSVPPPHNNNRESAWSTTSSAPPHSNVVATRSSASPPSSTAAAAPTGMSPQSSTVEVQQQTQPQQQASNVHHLQQQQQQQQQIQIHQQQQQQQGLQQQIHHPNLQELRSEERGLYLIQLLLSCSHAVANGNMEYTNLCLEQLSFLASLTGDSMQRVASYFMEGLAARITRSWPGVFKALHCTQYPSTVEVLSARQVFFNMCPYLKFAFLTINQAILDSMEGERIVHIIDLQAADAVQWLALLQALRARPGGPPLLKISGISEKKDVLEQMGQRLTEEANRLDIPFQFLPVVARLDDVTIEMLKVKPGEAVAVSSVMRLHLLLFEEDEHPQPQRANGVYTTGPDPAAGKITAVEPEAPKGEVVNGVVNGSKARSVFRSTGVGTFERVLNGDQKSDVGPLAPGTASAEARDSRGLKRSREASDGEDHQPRKIPAGSPSRGASSVVSEGNTQDSHDTQAARQQQFGNSEGRSEVVDRERTSSLAGGGGGPAIGTLKPLKPEAAQALVMDKVLRMLKQLAPKVMVVVEQESNHNSNRLEERFVQALHYYCALFDSLDSTLPQHFGLERVTLEKHLFGVEIKNIVACEGLERVERHEKLDKWKVRLRKAGFSGLPLSYSTVMQAKRLLGSYQCEGYRLNEGSGCLTLAWQETPLYAASAWHA